MEQRGGEVENGVIILEVPHFSTYGVFAEAPTSPPVDEDDQDKETGKELPVTATSLYNWLALGLHIFLESEEILVKLTL